MTHAPGNHCPSIGVGTCFFFFFFFFFYLFRAARKTYEVSRLGVESELQLLAYTTATAMPDPSHVCNLHHSSWQQGILNPLSEATDGTRVFMDTSRFHYH